ncbi:hypothetical protein DFH08DRAFT_1086111 [Mycena albidolilacea]|uniref:F-box domain-containing protein n=1 Tax=Mycena albidolilacea TaxID=1033008 RepID=A0AAD6ZFK0_9AGAR|nr:hypothetical protein DFH08DRAFT_1086111 [Mycena albidolilacea]
MLNTLAADRALVADLDAKIQDLERTLSALRSEKLLAEERLDAYKYPVLALPNEIVCEIFIHFLPIYPICPPLTGLLSPILLTHICRRWREMALALPVLWRAITMYRNDDLVSTVLSRSGRCPLSIHIDDSNNLSGFLAILPEYSRLEYLKFRLTSFRDGPCIDGPMPLLRHIDFILDYTSEEPYVLLGAAPLLRTAIFDVYAAMNVMSTFPWAQLTSLTLTAMVMHECFPILQKTPDLVHYELHLHLFDEPSHSQGVEVTLPSLESLVLRDPDPDEYPPPFTYLQHFIVPTLRSLQIPERFLEPDPIDALASFISKSGCKLQRVDVTNRQSVPESSYRTAFPGIPMFVFTPYMDN